MYQELKDIWDELDQHSVHRYTFKIDWSMLPGKMVELNHKAIETMIITHPHDFLQVIQERFGTDMALDMAKVLLHQRIDRIWKRDADFALFKETGILLRNEVLENMAWIKEQMFDLMRIV